MKAATCILLIWISIAFAQWTEPQLIDWNEDTVGINTGSKEWCPFISADGQYFYFAREASNNDLFVCHRTETGWSEPLMLPFCEVVADERNPSVNATNDTLYFIMWSGTWDIFWSFRTGSCDTCWGEPECLPEPLNSTGIEFSVWATPDNERLLFSSWRISANGEDIYECRRDAATPTGWSEPNILEGVLNTWDMESYPSMSLDTTEIFFWGRYSRLYRSVLTANGWLRGDSLPDTINRVIIQFPSERTPCITPDGHRLYFMSRWNYGETATAGDIWYSERPESAAPEPDRSGTGKHQLEIATYPNPFNSTNTITLSIPSYEREVEISIINTLGQIVNRETVRAAGGMAYYVNDMSGFASGVYFVRAQAGEYTAARKIVLMK
jgi:hypothetical protein